LLIIPEINRLFAVAKSTAREIYKRVGYRDWRNFNSLVRRAQQLISNGGRSGSIVQTTTPVVIGSGATRHVVDYELDEEAASLLEYLASSFKLTSTPEMRNECAILRLLAKYYLGKGVSFVFQKRVGSFVYDALVGDQVAVEFDEPHHVTARSVRSDAKKDVFAAQQGWAIFRMGLSGDVVDAILAIDQMLTR
jgi:very-short-patch-repair endonuclease